MTVRIGANPIAWSNDDLQSLGAGTSLETCLTQAHHIGFQGIELGHKFPRDADQLRPIMEAHKINLVGGWYSTELLTRSVTDEITTLQDHLALLKAMDCSVFILAETSNAIHGNIEIALSKTPLISAQQMTTFCKKITELCSYIRDQGLVPAYHHHMGTVVETPDEIASFMDQCGPSVGLLLDTGHATFGGSNPTELARTYANEITHLHCKDVRTPVMENAKTTNQSFMSAVVDGVFTVPGDGDVEFPPVLEILHTANYDGWIVIEAEQDPDVRNPLTYMGMGYNTLTQMVLDAGFKF